MLGPGLEAPQQMTDNDTLNQSTGSYSYRAEMIVGWILMCRMFISSPLSKS